MKGFIFSLLLTATLVRAAPQNLAKRVDTIISRPSQKKVRFGVSIVEAETGRAVYSRNATAAMIPASNMKIVVTAAALRLLGPDFKYETTVGLIDSTLVVIGSGDPLLGDKVTDRNKGREPGWLLNDITDKLKDRRVTAVNDIVIDSTIFDDERTHPGWSKKELNRWYACQVSGLNYNTNCVEIIAETIAGKVNITLDPQTDYVRLINNAKATSKGPDTLWCARPAGANTITVMGKCHKKCRPVRVTVERPPAFLAYLLAEHLAARGIAVRGRFIEGKVTPDEKIMPLATYTTILSDVLSRCNKDSLGLAAEALLKTIAAHTGEQGSWQHGRNTISKHLSGLGIPDEQFYIDDGSGLSRQNKLSANAITAVLLDIYRTGNWQLYKESLAVGGVDGTIRRYFKESKYKAKVLGKTGYINSVKSFSGVCCTAKGDYIFSILTSNANAKTRSAVNDIAKAVIDSE